MRGIGAPWQALREEGLEPKDLFMPLPTSLFFLLDLMCALNTSLLALFLFNNQQNKTWLL